MSTCAKSMQPLAEPLLDARRLQSEDETFFVSSISDLQEVRQR